MKNEALFFILVLVSAAYAGPRLLSSHRSESAMSQDCPNFAEDQPCCFSRYQCSCANANSDDFVDMATCMSCCNPMSDLKPPADSPVWDLAPTRWVEASSNCLGDPLRVARESFEKCFASECHRLGVDTPGEYADKLNDAIPSEREVKDQLRRTQSSIYSFIENILTYIVATLSNWGGAVDSIYCIASVDPNAIDIIYKPDDSPCGFEKTYMGSPLTCHADGSCTGGFETRIKICRGNANAAPSCIVSNAPDDYLGKECDGYCEPCSSRTYDWNDGADPLNHYEPPGIYEAICCDSGCATGGDLQGSNIYCPVEGQKCCYALRKDTTQDSQTPGHDWTVEVPTCKDPGECDPTRFKQGSLCCNGDCADGQYLDTGKATPFESLKGCSNINQCVCTTSDQCPGECRRAGLGSASCEGDPNLLPCVTNVRADTGYDCKEGILQVLNAGACVPCDPPEIIPIKAVCNNDGDCDPGENHGNCPSDCEKTSCEMQVAGSIYDIGLTGLGGMIILSLMLRRIARSSENII